MLRKSLLAQRQALAPEVRTAWDARIGARVWERLAHLSGALVGVYWPIRAEPDLINFYAQMASAGMRLCLPVVQGPDAPLQFHAWQPGDELVRDRFGAAVPVRQSVLTPQVLLIPCVGFNDRNYRLGYGGGFYDRTLASMPGMATLGIAYACARIAFEPAPHDLPLDAIITEMTDRVDPTSPVELGAVAKRPGPSA